MSVLYVNRRPCGCRHLAVSIEALTASMAVKITGGWCLQAFDREDAERLPTACDVCAPVRQGQLL